MNDVYDSPEIDEAAKQGAEEELQCQLEQALREALTKGVSMGSLRWLSYGCGISLARITGEQE